VAFYLSLQLTSI